MTSEDQLEVLPRLILVSVLLVGVEGVCPLSSDLYEDTVKFLKSCFWHSDKEVIHYTFISGNFRMEIFVNHMPISNKDATEQYHFMALFKL